MSLECIDFSLGNCVNEALKMMGPRAREKGLDLISSIGDDVPDRLRGDPTRCRQVLVNLLGNAVKFTQHGQIEVTVSAMCVDGKHAWLDFAVRDTGVGISADKQAMIFDAFAQADASTTREYGGTGLGLAICSRIAHMMGGRISVESEPGVGSTFHFTVRLDIAEAAKETLVFSELSGHRALVIDENDTGSGAPSGILRSAGMDVDLAGDVNAAHEKLRAEAGAKKPFSLVVVNTSFAGDEGFAVVRSLAADPNVSAVPTMLLSAGGERGDALRCRDLGIAGYLSKPVSPYELKQAAAAALGTAAASGALITRHSLRENRRPLHLLLVEDNLVNQKLALKLLTKHGHSVHIANNGQEGLEALQRGSYDAVLMDLQMPVMGGIEACKHIRESESGDQHLPIIAMTAHALDRDRELCMASGMDGFVSKPVRVELLMSELERVVYLNAPAVQAESGPSEVRQGGASTVVAEDMESTPEKLCAAR
jgi:CheY-like chemotaxis protein